MNRAALTFSLAMLALFNPLGAAGAATCPALLNRQIPRLQDEKPQNLCQYAGQVVVVVNTASFCGFTPQYKALESLYSQYQKRGLVVLGFPSNDFSQEPGDNKAIADFCENTYGKTRVSDSAGPQRSPFFTDLKQASGGSTPQWNFHKYVIARDGKTVQSYGSLSSPNGTDFVKNIEKLLNTN